MPSIRKLAPEEVEAVQSSQKEIGPRQRIAEEYDRYLAEFAPGDYAEVELGEDESRLTVANRFKAAAQRRNVSLRFMRMKGNVMRFHVLASDAAESEENAREHGDQSIGSDTPPSSAAARSGRGRPRKKQDA